MTLQEVTAYFRTGYNFSKITGMAHTNIIRWRRIGYIPILSQNRIEQLTKGKLKANFMHAEKKYNVE